VIRLSKHTADEMDWRSILLSYIEETLAVPDRVTDDPTDPTLIRSYKSIAAFGGRVLRVVHRPNGADIFVVTAHWDRGARR
jgi:hypothetical protein